MEVIMQPSASKRVELIIKTAQQQERGSLTACSSIHANFSSEGHLSPSKKAKQKFQTMYMYTVSDKKKKKIERQHGVQKSATAQPPHIQVATII